MKVTTDIDIDVADRNLALDGIIFIPAMMESKEGVRSKHPTGVYFQDIPVDPMTGLSAFQYDKASDNGYFKVDFLNNSIYQDVIDEDHLNRLCNLEPEWDLFLEEEIVKMLPHLNNSFFIVEKIKPTCVEDLAVILALMRPAKRSLINKSRAEIDANIWKKDADGFSFKRAHAVAYAISIIVKLNLICEQFTE